jgi:hypothetical protein
MGRWASNLDALPREGSPTIVFVVQMGNDVATRERLRIEHPENRQGTAGADFLQGWSAEWADGRAI